MLKATASQPSMASTKSNSGNNNGCDSCPMFLISILILILILLFLYSDEKQSKIKIMIMIEIKNFSMLTTWG
jgi:hypothetical protein